MALSPRTRNYVIIAGILAFGGVTYIFQFNAGSVVSDGAQSVSNPVPVDFIIPQFDEKQTRGQVAFEKSCQACHGQFGLGSSSGPTFISDIYGPNIHADGAFIFAASQGSRQHHFNFGNMPEIDGVSDEDVQDITAYVRALQVANGIE